jgi:hypothetical protein
MKKVSRQKLALAAETIRSLTPANLGTVAGGAVVVVVTTNTSHSIVMVCNPGTLTVTIGTSGGSIAAQ